MKKLFSHSINYREVMDNKNNLINKISEREKLITKFIKNINKYRTKLFELKNKYNTKPLKSLKTKIDDLVLDKEEEEDNLKENSQIYEDLVKQYYDLLLMIVPNFLILSYNFV